jgi:hypothetical protein
MTDYIEIPGVQKRNFTIHVRLPEMSSELVPIVNPNDIYIARNGDTYITRNGDTYIAHNNSMANPRIIKGAKKRSFQVQVKHG